MVKELWTGEESGQGMVEYGLLLALLVIVCMTGLALFGASTHGMYENPIETSIVKVLGG